MTGVEVPSESFRWKLASRPELVEKVVMALKDRAEASGVCEKDRITGLVISLTEAITNAMVHGNLEIDSGVRNRTDGEFGRILAQRCANPHFAEREIQIDVAWDGKKCTWTISDGGQGFDVERLLAKLALEEPSAEMASGRGIMLMRAFMDDVRWSAGGREVRLTMGARNGQPEMHAEKRKQVVRAVKAKGFDAGLSVETNAIATGVSATGIDLLGKGLSQAKRLMIEIDVNGAIVMVPTEVAHVTTLASDWVRINCRFAPEGPSDSADDIERQQAAIDGVLRQTELSVGGELERRKAERRQFTEVVRIERKDGTMFHGVARDISRGGLAIVGCFELERGEMLSVTLEPGTATQVTVECELIRCQHLAGIYRDFGVRFLGNEREG